MHAIQGAYIVDADLAEAVARYLMVLRGADAVGLTATSFRFFTPDMVASVWQVVICPHASHAHEDTAKMWFTDDALCTVFRQQATTLAYSASRSRA